MKIAIDLGHGVGQDRGKIGIIREEEIIDSVGSLVIQGLKKSGHQVVEVRPRAQNVTVLESLSYRTINSNNYGAELYISIHANAGGGLGTEIFTYGGKKISETIKVLDNLVRLGFRNRGIKDGKNLYVIRHTNAPAMLIEICFVDSKSDVDKYNSIGALAIAIAIVKGINDNKTTDVVSTDPEVLQVPIIITKSKIEDWVLRLQKEINNQGFGKLLVDGVSGPKTLMAAPTIRINARGNITKLIQEKLGVSNDGIFGKNTKDAVIIFQINNNIEADGIIGKKTWRKLLDL